MFLDTSKSSTCSVLSCRIRLGNGCISNMSKDNKEGETSKRNPAVFIRYWSLAESQMVQSFEFLTAALSSRTYLCVVLNYVLSIVLGVCGDLLKCTIFCFNSQSCFRSYLCTSDWHKTWELLYPVVLGKKNCVFLQHDALIRPSSGIHRLVWPHSVTEEVRGHV